MVWNVIDFYAPSPWAPFVYRKTNNKEKKKIRNKLLPGLYLFDWVHEDLRLFLHTAVALLNVTIFVYYGLSEFLDFVSDIGLTTGYVFTTSFVALLI